MSAHPSAPPNPDSLTLFLFTRDPRTSHLPAEGIRIATGVSAWQESSISLYLGTDFLEALNDPASMLGAEIMDRYLMELLQEVDQVLVPAGATEDMILTLNSSMNKQVDAIQLASVLSRSVRVLHF